MSGKPNYQKFNALFGRKNDNRVALYLHELHREAPKDAAGNFTDTKLTALSRAMNDCGAAGKPEWDRFFQDVAYRFQNMSANPITNANDKEGMLPLIHSLQNAMNRPGSLEQLVWMLMNKIAILSTDTKALTTINSYDAAFVTSINTGNASDVLPELGFPASGLVAAGNDSGRTMFECYRFEKYLIKKWLDEDVNGALQNQNVSDFFSKFPGDAGRYARGDDGHLYEVDKAAPGGVKPLNPNLQQNDKCMTTGFKEAVAGECALYLQQCLDGDALASVNCKAFMSDSKYWENAKEEATNIDPRVLVQTLKAFGFKMEQYSEGNLTLMKWQSVHDWQVGVSKMGASGEKSLDPTMASRIINNSKLTGYLEMLVKRCNENPAILNKDYRGRNKVAVNPNYFNGTHLSKYGLLGHAASSGVLASTERTGLTVANSFALPVHVFAPVAVMRGGANVYVNPINDLTNIINEPHKQTWALLEGEYNSLVQRLKRNNKNVAPKDNEAIRELISKLRDAETKLNHTMLYAEKYAALIEVFRQHDPKNMLRIDDIEEFVNARNHYFSKVKARQDSLVSIIKTVAAAAVDELKQGVSSNSSKQTIDPHNVSLSF